MDGYTLINVCRVLNVRAGQSIYMYLAMGMLMYLYMYYMYY